MKIFRLIAIFVLVALGAAVFAFAVSKPAMADEATSRGCTWPNDNGIPDDTSAQVTNCVVAGHPVRIVAGSLGYAGQPCDASGPLDAVSAWVDGVKVVDRRDSSSAAWCRDAKAKIVGRIVIDDQLRLTVCETLGETVRGSPFKAKELKPGQSSVDVVNVHAAGTMGYAVSQCATTQLTTAATADPLYGVRTLPGLIADVSDDQDCPAANAALAGFFDLAQVSPLGYPTDILTLDGKPFDTASDDETSAGVVRQYRADLDGDGVEDTVSITERRTADYQSLPVTFAWRNGASGRDYPLDAAAFGVTGAFGNLTFFDTMSGIRLYYTAVDLNAMNGDMTDLEAAETDYGADADPAHGFTRRVYQILSDGTAKVVCQWSPRKRPEEFL